MKAFIQRVLSQTPAGAEIYYLAQRYAGGFKNFTIQSKIEQGARLLRCFYELGEKLDDLRTVEVGSGWTPVVPIYYWLHGQRDCHTFDTSRLLRPELVQETAKQFSTYYGELVYGSMNDPLPRQRLELLKEAVRTKATAHEILNLCNIVYHAPQDAADTKLPKNSVDLVYSNTVLEHLSAANVQQVFKECKRILRSGGYMLHLIDLSDHFSHSDKSISTINFLQFSERAYEKYNTRFIFQNRFRPVFWRQIFEQHEFEIVYWRAKIDGKAMTQLRSFPLDQAFRTLTPEEICTSSIEVVARGK